MDDIQKLQKELEDAAQIILASPYLVTEEQRKAAESVILYFRKTQLPFEVFCALLERSTNEYVLFETAGVMKYALIRQWTSLPLENIISLRQYLIQYMISRPTLAPYVKDRMVQIIAIIVKRGNINTPGTERKQILDELEGIIASGDVPKQLLACSIILAILQEYATTVKSADVGLTWEVHTQTKLQFQTTDLKKIFICCYRTLNALTSDEIKPVQLPVINKLLEISELILRWRFVVNNATRNIDEAFEHINESQNFPVLFLDETWKDVILDPAVVNLYFSVYWKIRESITAEYGLRCLVQLATLRGIVLRKEENKVNYFTNYTQNFLQFISLIKVQEHEAIGIASIFSKIVNTKSKTFANFGENIAVTFLEQLTCQTIFFAQCAAQQMFAEDCLYPQALEYILRTWYTVLSMNKCFPEEVFQKSLIQLFNVYLQIHLSAPDGIRGMDENNLNNEEIDFIEENDKVRFLQQLQNIGHFGRKIPDYSLPLLAKFLEDKTNKLREQLNRLAIETDSSNTSNSVILNNLYEDLHWLILIAGHVLCMECEGEEPLIPGEIMEYCVQQIQKGQVDINISMQLLASPQSNISDINEAEQKADHVIRLVASVFRLCEIERVAIMSNFANILSPELSSTLIWFLHRWALSYLLPKECNYPVISTSLLQAFGADSDGAAWTVNFLLNKVQTNINTFKCESSLIKETIDLLMVLVKTKEKCAYIIKSEHFQSLLEMTTNIRTDFTPTTKRSLMKVGVNIGLAFPDSADRTRYWEQLFGPLRNSFNQIVNNENFSKIYDQEPVRLQITGIYESLIGIFNDLIRHMALAAIEMYPYFIDLLNEIPRILSLYHNYQQIVQLVLEVMCECIKEMLCSLNEDQSKQIYHICMSVMKTYARYNSSRVTVDTTAEEDAYHDILLFMKMLSKIPNVTLFDLSDRHGDETEPNPASVVLYGMTIIIPLMNEELIQLPTFCQQYYTMLTSFCEVYPEKVNLIRPDLLKQILMSVGVGLHAFNHKVSVLCCDFIYALARNIYYENKKKNKERNEMLADFLQLMFDLVFNQLVNMDLISHMSTPIFCLICCYPDKYQEVAQKIVQAHPNYADRLTVAFAELISGVPMNALKTSATKFETNFDKFIINLKGFLLIK